MASADQTRPNLLIRALAMWGDLWNRIFELIGGVAYLIWDVLLWLVRAAFTRKIRFGRTALVSQIVRIGVRSTGIVMLVCACIGFILALQLDPSLREWGQQDKIANIVSVAVFRELGPLVAAIVLTGFAGASIAAEIGTMVVGEEIEALEAHALNPVRFLVVPRILATVIGLTLLTAIGDVTAVFFSGVMAVSFLDIPYEVYKTNILNQLTLSDFTTGLIKGGVFGLILSAIACHNGLKVTGGAAGVGKATTDTVVQTIVAVILADLMFTTIFFKIGWT